MQRATRDFHLVNFFYRDLFLHRTIKERAIKREGIKRETDNRASPAFRDFARRLKCSREWRISRSNLSSSGDSKLLLLALATKKKAHPRFLSRDEKKKKSRRDLNEKHDALDVCRVFGGNFKIASSCSRITWGLLSRYGITCLSVEQDRRRKNI